MFAGGTVMPVYDCAVDRYLIQAVAVGAAGSGRREAGSRFGWPFSPTLGVVLRVVAEPEWASLLRHVADNPSGVMSDGLPASGHDLHGIAGIGPT
jgi:hypothetical protein